MRELLDSNYQGSKRLLVLAYDNAEGDNKVSIDSFKKCFLPRVKIGNCDIEIDGRNFNDQSINDSIKQYDEIRMMKLIIIQQVVYWILLILKKSTD